VADAFGIAEMPIQQGISATQPNPFKKIPTSVYPLSVLALLPMGGVQYRSASRSDIVFGHTLFAPSAKAITLSAFTLNAPVPALKILFVPAFRGASGEVTIDAVLARETTGRQYAFGRWVYEDQEITEDDVAWAVKEAPGPSDSSRRDSRETGAAPRHNLPGR